MNGKLNALLTGFFLLIIVSIQAQPKTYMIILDGLASGTIERLDLKNISALKAQGTYYEEVALPLPAHPSKSDKYPWSCSLPNPVLMSGTVFIGQENIKGHLIQHSLEDQTTAFIVNDGAYKDVSQGFNIYMNLREKDEDLFRDELVIEKSKEVILTEDPEFMRIHMQGPGSAGHLSTDPENSERPWFQNVWHPESPYIRQMRKADALVGQFINWLKEENRLDNSIIMIMGDHGQAMTGAHPPYADGSATTELVIYGKGILQGQSYSYAEMIDLAPTIAFIHKVAEPKYAIGRVLKEAFDPTAEYKSSDRLIERINEMLLEAHDRISKGHEVPSNFNRILDISSWHEGLDNITMTHFLKRQSRIFKPTE